MKFSGFRKRIRTDEQTSDLSKINEILLQTKYELTYAYNSNIND